jgi:hypothetical protein
MFPQPENQLVGCHWLCQCSACQGLADDRPRPTLQHREFQRKLMFTRTYRLAFSDDSCATRRGGWHPSGVRRRSIWVCPSRDRCAQPTPKNIAHLSPRRTGAVGQTKIASDVQKYVGGVLDVCPGTSKLRKQEKTGSFEQLKNNFGIWKIDCGTFF